MELNHIQSNIIRPNKCVYKRLLFLRFRTGVLPKKLRTFFVSTEKISAEKEPTSRLYSCNLLFSNNGLQKIERGLPLFQDFPAFQSGMHMALELSTACAQWDAMYMLSAEDEANADAALQRILDAAQRSDLFQQLKQQNGQKIYNQQGQQIEHFGFRDGISNPELYDESGLRESYLSANFIIDEGDGNYGSFFVYQKYKQDVALFWEKAEQLAEYLKVSSSNAAAQVIGRHQDGTPLAHLDGTIATPDTEPDYSQDRAGLKCPFHAHIRKMNPRDKHLNSQQFYPGLPKNFDIRIIRRSITYQEGEEKGLLFMAYCGDIKRQFETLLRWANDEFFPERAPDIGHDPLLCNGEQGRWNDADGTQKPYAFGGATELLEGEYFYCPSIQFIKDLSL